LATLRKRAKTEPTVKSSDDAGCVIILVLALWYFGFVSFHSRDTGKALDRLNDIGAELRKAEEQLSGMTVLLDMLKAQADSLGMRRAVLEQQVASLETARDSIGRNLRAASAALTPPPQNWLQKVGRVLFSGVPGNLVAAALLGLVGLLYARVKHKAARVRSDSVNTVGQK